MGYSPWDRKESDMIELLTHTHTHTHTVAIDAAEDFCSCAALAKNSLKRDYMMDCGDIIYVECHFEMCSVIIIYFSTQYSMS